MRFLGYLPNYPSSLLAVFHTSIVTDDLACFRRNLRPASIEAHAQLSLCQVADVPKGDSFIMRWWLSAGRDAVRLLAGAQAVADSAIASAFLPYATQPNNPPPPVTVGFGSDNDLS